MTPGTNASEEDDTERTAFVRGPCRRPASTTVAVLIAQARAAIRSARESGRSAE